MVVEGGGSSGMEREAPGAEVKGARGFGRWRRVGVTLAVLVVILVGAGWLYWGGQDEPVVEGVPLSAWTRRLMSGDAALRVQAQVVVAAHAEEVVPWLEWRLRRPTSPAWWVYRRWGASWSVRVRSWFVNVFRPGEAWAEREAAAQALLYCGTNVPPAVWLGALRDPAGLLSVDVLAARGVTMLPVWRAGLKDSSARVRSLSGQLIALSREGGAVAIPELLLLLEDESAEVRRSAAGALGWVASGEPEVIEGLSRALADADGGVRQMAVGSLARWGVARLVPVRARLELLREDEDPQVRSNALVLLHRMDAGLRRLQGRE